MRQLKKTTCSKVRTSSWYSWHLLHCSFVLAQTSAILGQVLLSWRFQLSTLKFKSNLSLRDWIICLHSECSGRICSQSKNSRGAHAVQSVTSNTTKISSVCKPFLLRNPQICETLLMLRCLGKNACWRIKLHHRLCLITRDSWRKRKNEKGSARWGQTSRSYLKQETLYMMKTWSYPWVHSLKICD